MHFALSTCCSFRQVAAARVRVTCDGTSSLGHVAASLRVPLIEIGSLLVNGLPAEPGHRLGAEQVAAVRRPQRLNSARFLLDVHLGTVARRLRLGRRRCRLRQRP